MPIGIYISVPFCRTKCSYCNFASDVFSRAVFEKYVDRVCEDIAHAEESAAQMGGQFEREVDSIYLGGGTPTVLDQTQLERIFKTVREKFIVIPEAEATVECAPGTLTAPVIESLLRCGVTRVSLGVQSFVNQEAAAVGRLHKRATVLEEIARLRSFGIANINIDLIAGLPHQTPESWEFSLSEAIATGAPHVSVYMLEVDEDSRLGRELIAGGTRYHAHFVPDEEAVAEFYIASVERLQQADIAQYEISNFAQAGFESRHNLKYWTRQPYLGFGVDAHSMLLATGERRMANKEGHDRGIDAIRFSTADSLEKYTNGALLQQTSISMPAALEESFFLGLRLSHGVNLKDLSAKFGEEAIQQVRPTIEDFIADGLMERIGDFVRLTPKGKIFSNEVFERFIQVDQAV